MNFKVSDIWSTRHHGLPKFVKFRQLSVQSFLSQFDVCLFAVTIISVGWKWLKVPSPNNGGIPFVNQAALFFVIRWSTWASWNDGFVEHEHRICWPRPFTVAWMILRGSTSMVERRFFFVVSLEVNSGTPWILLDINDTLCWCALCRTSHQNWIPFQLDFFPEATKYKRQLWGWSIVAPPKKDRTMDSLLKSWSIFHYISFLWGLLQ